MPIESINLAKGSTSALNPHADSPTYQKFNTELEEADRTEISFDNSVTN